MMKSNGALHTMLKAVKGKKGGIKKVGAAMKKNSMMARKEHMAMMKASIGKKKVY